MLPLTAALTIALSAWGAQAARAGPEGSGKRLNVLIVSACSLRRDHIGLYGYPQETAPNLRRFSEHAFVFRNAYASKSWSGPGYFLPEIPIPELKSLGYEKIELPGARAFESAEIAQERGKERSLRLERLEDAAEYRRRFVLSTDILPGYHDDGLREIKEALQKRRERPFFLHVHFKYMHRPYYPPELAEPAPDFPAAQQPLLARYLAGQPAGLEKAPIYAILLDRDDQLLRLVPLDFQGSPLGLLNRREILDRWQKSPDYAQDIKLIVSAYDWKLRRFDATIGDLLALYGDEELRDNTVVFFLGDHGEPFMEHGFLMHGETVHDEEIAVPLLVRFPAGSGQRIIRRQFNQHSLVAVIRSILQGRLSGAGFARYLDDRVHDDLSFATNFRFTQRGVRASNKWKFIYDFGTGERRLYDLEKDPGETADVFAEHADVAAQLEDALLSRPGPPSQW